MLNFKYKTEWDLSNFYKGINDPKIDEDIEKSAKLYAEFAAKWRQNADYTTNPLILAQALKELEILENDKNYIARANNYTDLLTHLDQNNDIYIKLGNKIAQKLTDINNEVEFFFNQLAHTGYDNLMKLSTNSELAPYKHMLEKFALSAKYQLSEAEEKILNTTYKTSVNNWTNMVSALLADSEGKIIDENGTTVKLPLSQIGPKLESDSKMTRDTAAKAINKIITKYVKIAECEMNSLLENWVNIMKLKKIEKPNLPRFLSDDIDETVVSALVKAVSENYDIGHKYYELKAKILKTKKLKYHERNIPIGKITKKYNLDECIDITNNALKNLDPEFSKIFIEMAETGKIDFQPKKGKTSGAFCTYDIKNDPVYILMNFDETLNSITTLAHEMGHAINFQLMKVQNQFNYRTPLSTAEVASTYIEDYIYKELNKTPLSEEEKFILLMEKLNDEINTIFRQIACYQFEIELHNTFKEKYYLSAKDIGKIFNKHMKDCNGPFVMHDNNSAKKWVTWSHIRSFFYVYSYASGLLISKSMQNKTNLDKNFIKNVKEFLSTGASKSPKEIFNQMGIDITDKNFWQQGINEIRQDLDTAYQLAKKLNKI